MPTHDLIIIGAGSGNSIIGPEHDDMDVAIVECIFRMIIKRILESLLGDRAPLNRVIP